MKRLMDVAGSTVGLILFSPVFLVTAIIVRIYLGSPVLFRQRRPGLNGNPFTLVKFRTMSDARDENGDLLPDDSRIGNIGKFLRNSSLDELPELWNVLRGEMSLVGPRPLRMEYLTRYSAEQARRHEVKPGITGMAQVNGRNLLTWEKRFELDVWYVDHHTIWLDISILVKTVISVLSRHGVSAEGHATMPEFLGTTEQ